MHTTSYAQHCLLFARFWCLSLRLNWFFSLNQFISCYRRASSIWATWSISHCVQRLKNFNVDLRCLRRLAVEFLCIFRLPSPRIQSRNDIGDNAWNAPEYSLWFFCFWDSERSDTPWVIYEYWWICYEYWVTATSKLTCKLLLIMVPFRTGLCNMSCFVWKENI